MHYITNNNFSNLLEILSKEYEIFIPVKKENNRFYVKFSSIAEIDDKIIQANTDTSEKESPAEPAVLRLLRCTW